MSYAAEKWARAQRVGNARAKQVLIELANCLNDETGLCCPSLTYLHMVTELKKDTISAATAHLERIGLLKKVSMSSGRGRCIQYVLAWKKHPENGVMGNPENEVMGNPENGVKGNPENGVKGNPENGVKGNPENGVKGNPENGDVTDKSNRERKPHAPAHAPAHACESRIPVAPIVIEVKAWRVARALAAARDPGIDAITQGKGTASIGYLRQLLGSQDGFKRLQPYLVKHQIRI